MSINFGFYLVLGLGVLKHRFLLLSIKHLWYHYFKGNEVVAFLVVIRRELLDTVI